MRKLQKEILTIKKIPGMPFLRAVSGTDISNNFPKHIHTDLCIGIIIHGERLMTINGKDELLNSNDVFIINPGEPHICSSPEKKIHSYHIIILESDFILKIAGDISADKNPFIFDNFIKNDMELSLRMTDLIRTLLTSDMFIEKESMLYSFLEILIKNHSSAKKSISEIKKSSRAVQLIKKYIDDNYKEEISLADLSGLSGVSPFHLNRLFCSETGISPHAYQIQKKIEESKRLLLENNSIAQISLEMGFSDQSHFSKFFRKTIGTTPGNYIKHNKV